MLVTNSMDVAEWLHVGICSCVSKFIGVVDLVILLNFLPFTISVSFGTGYGFTGSIGFTESWWFHKFCRSREDQWYRDAFLCRELNWFHELYWTCLATFSAKFFAKLLVDGFSTSCIYGSRLWLVSTSCSPGTTNIVFATTSSAVATCFEARFLRK